MSKSYDNVIPIFASPKVLRKRIMRIKTNSQAPEEPKDPDTCNIFQLYQHFADVDELEAKRQHYLAGGLAYGEMKQCLFECLEQSFAEARRRYETLIKDQAYLEHILAEGAEKAHAIAQAMLNRMREAIGMTGH